MSDLEDIDPGAEELHLEEELSAHPGPHLESPEHPGDEPEENYEPPKSGGAAVLKIVIVAVILAAGGGGYFVLKSHNSTVSSRREVAQALSVPPLPKATNNSDNKHGDNAMAAWNNATPAPAAAPAPPVPLAPANGTPASIGLPAPITAPPAEIAGMPANPVAAASNAVPVPPAAPPSATATAVISPVAPSMPEAIPSMPPSGPASGSSTGTAALSATPPIVNEQPPSTALLTSAQGAAPAQKPNTPVPPAPSSPIAAPDMVPSAIPGAIPSAIPGAAPGSPVPGTKAAAVFAQKSPAAANAGPGADTLLSPLTPPPKPQIKNGEAMPSDIVPPVDRTDTGKTDTVSPEMPKAKTFTPITDTAEEVMPSPKREDKAEDSAKVEELQKKIDELEKTISQLQQSPVTKEDAEKTASETSTEGTAVPKASHKKLAQHRRPSAKTHAAATAWVLKAAKPGVAWIARKGTDDLKMVEVGDSLAGVGRITAIVKSSSGNWTVSGTRGRISQ